MKPELRTIIAGISMLLYISAFAGGPDTPHWSVTWKRLNMTGPAMELSGVLNPLPTRESAASQWSIGCETLGHPRIRQSRLWSGEIPRLEDFHGRRHHEGVEEIPRGRYGRTSEIHGPQPVGQSDATH
ncbi:MAG: hypothetical protein ACI3ZC_06850 [Candidatus Cryptobacteroides sp.]